MSKIGIITFHHAHNYGAVLQCLALKTVVYDLGHEAVVVNHINKKIEKAYKLSSTIKYHHGLKDGIKSIISLCLTIIPKSIRIRKFKQFINNYIITPKDHGDSCKDLDAIICGSDQIWREEITDNDLFYWGKTDNKNLQKIAYSASAGKFDDRIDKNLYLLNEFDCLSVREEDLLKYLAKKGIDAIQTIDPTLLLDRNKWLSVLPIRRYTSKPYVLVYALRDRKKVLEIANQISVKEQLPIKEILSNKIFGREIFKRYNAADPIEFLSLIYGASYIVTDSFHGTVFAIIFQKPFVTVKLNDGQDNRAWSLLTSIGIPDRISTDGLNYREDIDYESIQRKIQEMREVSLTYLRNATDF